MPDYLKRTGYRLPTDVEWEFACRAGTATAFSWGNDPVSFPRFAWTLQNSQGHNWPVGSLCPNRFGLFDVHGNASEWVQDTYDFQNDGKPVIRTGEDTEETDWRFSDDSFRDVRGGSGSSHVEYHRSANRTPTRAAARFPPSRVSASPGP